MNNTWYCSTCQRESPSQTCIGCGRKQGEVGGNPLILIAWLFIFFLIPVYPIAGIFASLALGSTVGVTELLDVPDVLQIILAPIATYVALFLTFKYEQRAANSRAYRIFRDVFRLVAGVVVVIGVLKNEGIATPADTLFIAVFGVPLTFWALKRIDRVFGAAGPPKPRKAKAVTAALSDAAPRVADDGREMDADEQPAPTFWNTLSWRTAATFGAMLSIFGFILGKDAQLFTVAFLFLAITGGILAVQIVGRLFGMSFGLTSTANKKLGRVPGAIVYGAGFGGITGAVLTKLIDGRVQIEGVIIVAIVGVPIALVVNRLRARRRRATASGSQ